MSQPTPSDVHVDAALTNLSVAYIQDQNNFIADKVFPSIPVQFQSNKYFTYTKNDWFRDDAVQKRAPATESSGGGMGLSTDTYSCDVWATHYDLADQVRRNADPAVDLDRAGMEVITQRMLIRRERQFASDYFTTGIWGTDVVGGTDFTSWSDFGGSDPQADIETAKNTVLKNTGRMPNTLVVSYQVHNKLKQHPLVKEQFKYTSAQSITEEMLAAFFEVERYLVAKSTYATNNEGAAGVYDFSLGASALLCYVAPNPGLMVPSAGYNFVWSGLTGINGLGVAVSRFRMDTLKADRIEGEFAFDMKVVGSDLGYFFSAAV